eukprot:1094323-Prymnesium_polylepis.3
MHRLLGVKLRQLCRTHAHPPNQEAHQHAWRLALPPLPRRAHALAPPKVRRPRLHADEHPHACRAHRRRVAAAARSAYCGRQRRWRASAHVADPLRQVVALAPSER